MKIDRPYPVRFALHFNEERDSQHRYELHIGKESFGGSSPEAALRKALDTLHYRGRVARAKGVDRLSDNLKIRRGVGDWAVSSSAPGFESELERPDEVGTR